MLLDMVLCATHGFATHVIAHESAHAVFAYDLGFPFVEVRILPPGAIARGLVDGEPVVAGGVLMATPDPRLWVADRAEDALDFALAGTLAEETFLGHSLPSSLLGDSELWRRGMGMLTPIADRDALLREWVTPARRRTLARIADRREAIASVWAGLGQAIVPGSAAGRVAYRNFDTPIVVSFEDVRGWIEHPVGGSA